VEQTKVTQALEQVCQQLGKRLQQNQIDNPVIVGVHTGGVWVAEQIHRFFNTQDELGALNITFYRDDFSQIGLHPRVEPSQLPFDVEGRHVILIDDVISTGRTVRAALNELFDYGRPATVTLVALVNLEQKRELPIQPDIVGLTMELEANQQVKLTGPEPLQLELQTKA